MRSHAARYLCYCDASRGLSGIMGTNTEKPDITARTAEDKWLWVRNKWLLTYPDSGEAKQGAHIGLAGENIDTASLL